MIRPQISVLPILLAVALGSACARGAEQPAYPPGAAKLMLWAKAEDIKTTDGAAVERWDDASGWGHHLLAVSDNRPEFRAAAGKAHAAVVFQAAKKQRFAFPWDDEWNGMSIFIVGTGLSGQGLLDTNTVGLGSVRDCGWMQFTGNKCGSKGLVGLKSPTELALAELVVRTDTAGVTHFGVYGNGTLLEETQDSEAPYGVVFKNGRLGAFADQVFLNGSMSEVVLYKGPLTEAGRQSVEAYLLSKYGLRPRKDTDPTQPAFYAPPAPHALPKVTGQPATDGLKVWARADDLDALQENAPVMSWPNAAGDKQPLTGDDAHHPIWLREQVNGRPAVHFEGNAFVTPKKLNWLKIPLPEQTLEGATVIVVGRNINSAGAFDSAPLRIPSMRIWNGMQLTGVTFPTRGKLNSRFIEPGAPMIHATTFSRFGDKGCAIRCWMNGVLAQHNQSSAIEPKVLIRNPQLGMFNDGEIAFTGDIAEVLIYTRALNDAELKQTSHYLSEKYSIPFPKDSDAERLQTCRSPWGAKYPTLPHTVSWVGNSFNGLPDWVQLGIWNCCALPDGTVAVLSVYDEPHKELGLYKDGKVVAAPVVSGGGQAVCTDGQYLYKAHMDYWQTKTMQVRRYTADLKEAPWKELGKAEWITWPYDPKEGFDDATNVIRGLAVSKDRLYISLHRTPEIRVFYAKSGAAITTFAVDAPATRLACDADGNLWLGDKSGARQYTADGKATGKQITNVSVGALTFDAQNHLLLADNGERSQVITYDIAQNPPAEIGAFGVRGGLFAAPNPGRITPDRVWGLNGIGVDAQQNLYLSNNTGVRAFSKTGTFLWEVHATSGVSTGCFDSASDGQDIYSRNVHFHYRPGQPPGKDWDWVGVMMNDARYARELKPGPNTVVRHINGRLYDFSLANEVIVSRQIEEHGEAFAPCNVLYRNFHPRANIAPAGLPKDQARFIWTDLNGDGHPQPEEIATPPKGSLGTQEIGGNFVDERGGLWCAEERRGIRYLPLRGVAPSGALLYNYDDEKIFPRPAEFIKVFRTRYYPDTDTMYLAGTTWDDPVVNGRANKVGLLAGREIIRYDDWTKPTRKLVCRMKCPEKVSIICIDAAPASNLLFAGDVETAAIFAFDATTGKLIGILEPDEDKLGNPGWIDTQNGISCTTTKSGETLVECENCYYEGEIIYRIPKLP